MTRNYSREVLVFGAALLFMAVSDAQPKADVIIGVILIHVNSERAEHLAASLNSPSTAELLSTVLADKGTELVTRSQLRTADRMKVHLQLGADVAIDLTPQIQSLEELTLRVGITASALNPVPAGGTIQHPLLKQNQSITTLSLRGGELNLLCGLSGIPGLTYLPVLDKTRFGAQGLMIALIPQILRPAAPAP